MDTTLVRVGIIGCGNVALNFHLPAYQSLPGLFTVNGLADPAADRLELGREAAGLSVNQVHSDALELIARDDIDVIDVCTPQHLHRDLVIAAARAGKHVLSEKPLAAVPRDAAAMVHAADEYGVRLGVVHNYLFFPEIVAIRKIIDSGQIGTVRTVNVDMLGVIDSPGAAGYRPEWRKDPALSGGGVLMDMLHGVYLAQHLLGTPVSAVSAFVDARDGDAVEDLALCRLESGRSAALVNVGWGLGRGGVSVHGTKGRLQASYQNDGTMPWAPFERLVLTTETETRTLEIPAGKELVELVSAAMRDTVADFAHTLRSARPSAATGAEALATLEATVAAYASAALGHSISLPLDTNDPLHTRGILGLQELSIPDNSPVGNLGLYGLNQPAGV